MSKLTVNECKRIIMQGKKQLTEAEQRIAELEANNGSQWFELFGTPEKAARTLIAVRGECESSGSCYPNCPFGDAPTCPSNCESRDYDALLEWLRGDA
jgi:hypothetical protein